MTHDMDPTPGPSLDSVYVPGTPGAPWTDEEIETTRFRILQAIHPDWWVKRDMYGDREYDRTVTENRLMRLSFHDCVKYTGDHFYYKISMVKPHFKSFIEFLFRRWNWWL